MKNKYRYTVSNEILIIFIYNIFKITIRHKSKEELLNQAEWFLDYAEKEWKIKEKQRTKISKILWLSNSEKKRFLERFFRKNWK